MLWFVVVGILIPLFMRRNPLNVFRVPFRYPSVAIICLVLQIVLGIAGANLGIITDVLLPASFVVILIWLIVNRSIPGLFLIAIGTALNLCALFANGGHMPVSADAMTMAGIDPSAIGSDHRHFQAFHTSLWWLTDFIPLFGHVYSPGDIAVAFGLMWFIYKNSRARV